MGPARQPAAAGRDRARRRGPRRLGPGQRPAAAVPQGPRGYPGWLPLAQLAAPAEPTGEQVVVTEQVTELRDGPDGRVVADDVSYATVLPARRRQDSFTEVTLPGGGTGWLADKHLDTYRARGPLPTTEQLVAAGRLFLGLMYLAGGTHGLMLDCSGLPHLIYRRFGHSVPRDASDLALLGEHVEVAELAPATSRCSRTTRPATSTTPVSARAASSRCCTSPSPTGPASTARSASAAAAIWSRAAGCGPNRAPGHPYEDARTGRPFASHIHPGACLRRTVRPYSTVADP
ncbi:hypothetical protein ACFQZ4_38625 [Catellatospora coxensis]